MVPALGVQKVPLVELVVEFVVGGEEESGLLLLSSSESPRRESPTPRPTARAMTARAVITPAVMKTGRVMPQKRLLRCLVSLSRS